MYFLLLGKYFSVTSMAERCKRISASSKCYSISFSTSNSTHCCSTQYFGKWGNSCSLTWHSERWMLANWHHSNTGNSWERDGKGTGYYHAKHLTVLDIASEKKVQFIYSTIISPLILLPFKHPWRYLPRDSTLLKSRRLNNLRTTRKFAPKWVSVEILVKVVSHPGIHGNSPFDFLSSFLSYR